METISSCPKLENLPFDIQTSLKTFFRDEDQVKILENQLLMTPIIIDDGKFQISISTIDELHEIIESLKEVHAA